jgi:hypothetical protein
MARTARPLVMLLTTDPAPGHRASHRYRASIVRGARGTITSPSDAAIYAASWKRTSISLAGIVDDRGRPLTRVECVCYMLPKATLYARAPAAC